MFEDAAVVADGRDDGLADGPGEEPVAELDEARQRRRQARQPHEVARDDRLTVGKVDGALRIPSAEQLDARHGEAMVDGGPREPPVASSIAGAASAVERQASRCGEGEVAGRRGGRTNRVGPVSVHSPPRATSARPAGAPPMASSASGRDEPARDDDGDEVAAESALRRQQHRLGERRGHRSVEGVAAVTHRRCPGLGGQRRGCAHDSLGAAAGALLGHHRELGRRAHRINRSDGTREKWVCTPSHGAAGESRRNTTVARPGRATVDRRR